MGAGASLTSAPLEDWSSHELAEAVEKLGGQKYAEAAEVIRSNGVDGGTVADEESLGEMLGEVELGLLQKKRLAREFRRLQEKPVPCDGSRYKLRLRNFGKAAGDAKPWSLSAEGVATWLAAETAGDTELERLAEALDGASGVDLLTVCVEETDRPPFCKLRRDARGESLLRTRLFKITTIRALEATLLACGLGYFFALWHASDVPSMLLLDLVWETRLGSGSYGDVHGVVNRHTAERRAVKLVKIALDDASTIDDKLFDEPSTPSTPDGRVELACAAVETAAAEMAAQQRAAKASEYVVGLDAWGSFGGCGSPVYVYSIMELCDGTLADEMTVGVDATRRLLLFSQLAAAVRDIHAAGLIHLDIKPQNVLLASGTRDVRLADLGLATLDASRTTHRSRIGGTRAYTAPEVATGIISNKADMYSLAMVFFEIAAGSLPDLNAADVLAPIRALGDQRTLDIVASLLHMAPADRPTADQLHRAIGFQARKTASSSRPSCHRQANKKSQRRRIVVERTRRPAASCAV